MLKKVAVNERYLTTADRETFRKDSAAMNLTAADPTTTVKPTAAVKPAAAVKPTVAVKPAPSVNAGPQARMLVRQAGRFLHGGRSRLGRKERQEGRRAQGHVHPNRGLAARILADVGAAQARRPDAVEDRSRRLPT